MKLKGLYQKTDSKIWYYQPPMAKGVRPKPISLGTKSEEEAVAVYYAVASQLEEQFRRGSIRMELARYVQEKKSAGLHSAATTDHTERTMEQVIKLLGNREVSSYTADDMKSLRETWTGKNLSAASIASYFGRVGAFFAWAVKEGLTKKSPLEGVTMNRRLPTRAERYCSKEERDKLIAALPANRLDLSLCLWLGFFAGFRKMDIVEARRDWIDLEGGVITVRPTETYAPKGKKARRIRMSPRLKEFLKLYMESIDFKDSVYLLRPEKKQGRKQKKRGKKAWRYRWDPRRPFHDHVTAAGLEWVGFHTLRHTFATLHALAGTPLTTIAKELGDQYKVVYENYVGYTRHDNHSAAAD
jgi:integrase